MSGVQTLLQGVIADLRQRKLLPVAVVLLVALIAAPIALHKPAEDVPAPATPASSQATPTLPNGEATAPLVTMAALNDSSDLGSFKPKNPFKPLRALGDKSPDDVLNGSDPFAALPGGAQGGGGGGGGDGSAPGAENLAPGATTPDSGGGGSAPAPGTPGPQTQAPGSGGGKRAPAQRFTYAVDVRFETPKRARRARNLPRLSMLPSEQNPLLVFLGVDDGGDDAVFLVDASLTSAGGEGKCGPSKDDCATLRIAPGARHSFVDASGAKYTIEIEQIRTVRVTGRSGKAGSGGDSDGKSDEGATSSRADRSRKVARTSSSRRARRFELPDLVDFIVESGK